MDKRRHEQLEELLHRYLGDQATAEERDLLQRYADDPVYAPSLGALIESAYLKEENPVSATDAQREAILRHIFDQSAPVLPTVKVRLWPRLAAAALAVIALNLVLYYYIDRTDPVRQSAPAMVQDIDPGSIGATLTLADGRQIQLGAAVDGEIAQEAGMRVSKTADGQLVYEQSGTAVGRDQVNTLRTQNGETYMLTLPDQSKVWLNAASSISYTTDLHRNSVRSVTLTGEAYFEITPDQSRPFVVRTGDQEVEVLGTAFNVNSYADEANVATTLLSGSVRVRVGKREQIIVPGEQLQNNGHSFQVVKIDTGRVTDWKNGEFNLQQLPLRTAMRKIARWYDVELAIDPSVPDHLLAGGWISRDVKLSTILAGIERSGQVKFRLEGRKLYAYK